MKHSSRIRAGGKWAAWLHRRWSLLTVLAIVAVSSVLGIGLLLGLVASASLQSALDREKAARLQSASLHARHFDEMIQSALSLLEATAGLEELFPTQPEPIAQQGILRHAFQGQPYLRTVCLLDAQGSISLTQPPDSPVPPITLEETWLERVLAGEGSQISDMPLWDSEGRVLLGMASPLYGEGGTVAGVLVGFLDLSHPHWQEDIEALVSGRTGYNSLVTADGTVVASSQRQRLFQKSNLPGPVALILQRGEAVMATHPEEDQPSGRDVVAIAPLSTAPLLLVVEQDEGEFLAPLHTLRRRFLFAGLTLVAMALVVTAAVTSILARPLRRLSGAAAEIASGDLEARAPAGGIREVSDLGLALEDMRQRVQHRTRELEATLEQLQNTQEQLIQSDRLAAIGELVSGVAHEVNNPLTAVLGYAELLLGKDLDEAVKSDLEVICRETQRAATITQNLLSFARQHKPEKSYISINEAVESTVALRAYEMKVNNIEVVTELQPDLPRTMADAQQLRQVFLNIVLNAEQAMAGAHGRGKLAVKTQEVDHSIQIVFADDGPGIPREYLSRVFDPFFTTKEVGKGTGLGLSIGYGIVREHGGNIRVESKMRKGATFTVEIPVVGEEAVAPVEG